MVDFRKDGMHFRIVGFALNSKLYLVGGKKKKDRKNVKIKKHKQ